MPFLLLITVPFHFIAIQQAIIYFPAKLSFHSISPINHCSIPIDWNSTNHYIFSCKAEFSLVLNHVNEQS